MSLKMSDAISGTKENQQSEFVNERLHKEIDFPSHSFWPSGSPRDPCSTGRANVVMSDAAKMQAFYHTGRLKMFHFAE